MIKTVLSLQRAWVWIPGQGTKILYAAVMAQPGEEKKNQPDSSVNSRHQVVYYIEQLPLFLIAGSLCILTKSLPPTTLTFGYYKLYLFLLILLLLLLF